MIKGKFSIAIYIGMFIIFYNPPFLPFNSMHLVGFFSIIYIVLNHKLMNRYLRIQALLSLGLFFTCIFLYLCVKTIFQNLPLSTLVFPIYILLDIIPFGLVVGIMLKKKNLSTDQYFLLIISVGLLQALIAIGTILIPEFKQLVINQYIRFGYGEKLSSLAYFRNYGLAAGLLYSTPILQSIIAIIAVYLSINKSKIYIIYVGLIAMSAVINARTAVVVIAVGILLLVFLNSFSIKRMLLFFSLLLLFSFVIYKIIPFIMDLMPDTFMWIQTGINEIVSFISGDATGYFSYVAKKDIYRLPPNLSLLWGEGYRVMGGYKGFSSDIGYINDLWFGGLLYVLFLYSYFFSLSLKLIMKKKKLVSFVGMFMLILYPILNIKGIAYTMNDFTNFFILTYVVIVVTKYPTSSSVIECSEDV